MKSQPPFWCNHDVKTSFVRNPERSIENGWLRFLGRFADDDDDEKKDAAYFTFLIPPSRPVQL